MAKTLSCADALRVLGHSDSDALRTADTVAGSAGDLTGVPGLGLLGGQLITHGTEAVRSIRERLSGISRLDRTQRIAAAHSIIVVVSYFEALDEVLREHGSSLRDLEFSKEEQAQLASGRPLAADYSELLDAMLSAPIPLPSVDNPYETNSIRLARYLAGMGGRVGHFLAGLAAAPALEPASGPAGDWTADPVTERALARYDIAYRDLMTQVPEFAMWAGLIDHQATRSAVEESAAGIRARLTEISTDLDGFSELLARMTSGGAADQRRGELAVRHQAALKRPVLATADAPDGFSIPTLAESYVSPSARLRRATGSAQPSVESWWQGTAASEDLQALLLGLLTEPAATEQPIVVLGHPGAGKSVLTKMLAGRLPAEDFLPVRVELRGVPADAPIQDHIEHGVYEAVGERVSWPEVARSCGDALPVVLLDGFDELLQATGVNRSDYLEQVREFQSREAELGRPVVVVVTSRTVVADRARFPEGSPVLRLEPFDDARITRVIDVWNRANAATLAARGLTPPSAQAVLRYSELAEQPLMLMMLLIFDADGNGLQRMSRRLDRARLYEELLRAFARREVAKHRPQLSDAELSSAVEGELRRLEVVALAMFARRRQTVASGELGKDTAILLPEEAQGTDPGGLHGLISDADQLLGRFFFIHESRALQGFDQRGVFEFLHATFGEYLVARLLAATLGDLVSDREHAARRRYSAPVDDGLFYAVASFAAITGRATAVEFLEHILRRHFAEHPGDRAAYRSVLVEQFQDAPFPRANRSYAGYEPRRVPIVARQAVYTANLAALLVVVAEEAVDITELLPEDTDPLDAWTTEANLWRGCLAGDEWFGLLSCVRVRHIGYTDGRPHTLLERETGGPINVGECVGFELAAESIGPVLVNDPYGIVVSGQGSTASILRSVAMRANGSAARALIMLLPYAAHTGDDLLTWFGSSADSEEVWAETYDLLELRLAPPTQDQEGRLARYTRLLNTAALGRIEALVLRQAAEDLRAWPEPWNARLGEVVEDFLTTCESIVPELPASTAHQAWRELWPHITPEAARRFDALLDHRSPLEVPTTPGADDVDSQGRPTRRRVPVDTYGSQNSAP